MGKLLLMVIVLIVGLGFSGCFTFFVQIFHVVFGIFKLTNDLSVDLTGTTILGAVLISIATYIIVKRPLNNIDMPKGKLGSSIGKCLYYFVNQFLSFFADIISKI